MTYVDGDSSFNNRQPSCAISVVSIRALRRPLPTSTKKRSLALVVLSSKTEKELMDALLLLLGSWRPTSTALELWAPIDMIRSVP